MSLEVRGQDVLDHQEAESFEFGDVQRRQEIVLWLGEEEGP